MLSRRGFLGVLAAIVAAPRAVLARQPLTTLGLSESGTYRLTYTFVTAKSETPVSPTLTQLPRKLYIDGKFVADVPPGANTYVHTEAGGGGYFTYPDAARD